jgi:benzoyl-CoA reductase/2-hydroxyglutaryl-CoA dehydratase subunit BcrC/BadD/HgdB
MQKLALDKNNDIRTVILGTIEEMKTLNPEALECKNGKKIIKPSWILERLEKHREKYRKEQEDLKEVEEQS